MLANATVVIILKYINVSNQRVQLKFTQCLMSIISIKIILKNLNHLVWLPIWNITWKAKHFWQLGLWPPHPEYCPAIGIVKDHTEFLNIYASLFTWGQRWLIYLVLLIFHSQSLYKSLCVYVYIHTATPCVHLVHLAYYSNLFRFLLSLFLLAPCWWKLPTAICMTSWSSVPAIANKKSVLLGFSPCSCCNASF